MVTHQDWSIIPVGPVHLVFGLDWYVILEAQVNQAAQRLARRHKASYWAVSDQVNSAAGLLFHKLPQAKTTTYVAAALLFTRQYPHGSHALILPLDKHGWWLLAWHDGAVIRDTDRLYMTQALATAALEQLQPAYPGLQLIATSHCPPWDQLVAAPTQTVQLRPVPRIPLRSWLLGAGVVALLAGGVLLAWHGLSRGAHSDSLAALDTQQAAEQAWQQALDRLLAQHWLHGAHTTKQVLTQLYDLPLMLGGWQLSQAQCQAQQQQWSCVADFQRYRPDASNASLLQHQPEHWSLQFTPFKQAQARWTVPAVTTTLAEGALLTEKNNEQVLFSELQRLMLGFRSLTVSSAKPLNPITPVDAQGQAHPQPSVLPRYQTRTLRVSAPLRTISVLLPHMAHMRWDRIHLQFGSEPVPALLQSAVTASLEGVLYEMQ